MRREGDAWVFQFEGRTARVRRRKGFDDLARLLAQPHQPISALDLAGAQVIERGTGPTLDREARRSYRDRLTALDRQLADGPADTARARERDALRAELATSTGLTGRPREPASSGERARGTVSFRIRSAIRELDDVDPALAEHLRAAIRTGHTCEYAPPPGIRWDVSS